MQLSQVHCAAISYGVIAISKLEEDTKVQSTNGLQRNGSGLGRDKFRSLLLVSPDLRLANGLLPHSRGEALERREAVSGFGPLRRLHL